MDRPVVGFRGGGPDAPPRLLPRRCLLLRGAGVAVVGARRNRAGPDARLSQAAPSVNVNVNVNVPNEIAVPVPAACGESGA